MTLCLTHAMLVVVAMSSFWRPTFKSTRKARGTMASEPCPPLSSSRMNKLWNSWLVPTRASWSDWSTSIRRLALPEWPNSQARALWTRPSRMLETSWWWWTFARIGVPIALPLNQVSIFLYCFWFSFVIVFFCEIEYAKLARETCGDDDCDEVVFTKVDISDNSETCKVNKFILPFSIHFSPF